MKDLIMLEQFLTDKLYYDLTDPLKYEEAKRELINTHYNEISRCIKSYLISSGVIQTVNLDYEDCIQFSLTYYFSDNNFIKSNDKNHYCKILNNYFKFRIIDYLRMKSNYRRKYKIDILSINEYDTEESESNFYTNIICDHKNTIDEYINNCNLSDMKKIILSKFKEVLKDKLFHISLVTGSHTSKSIKLVDMSYDIFRLYYFDISSDCVVNRDVALVLGISEATVCNCLNRFKSDFEQIVREVVLSHA